VIIFDPDQAIPPGQAIELPLAEANAFEFILQGSVQRMRAKHGTSNY
jgi:hypothetical protein